MADWATAADVLDVTGVEVDAAAVRVAQGVVALTVDRDPAAEWPVIKTRDLARLRQAVAYQCAFMKANPDVFDRNDVDSESFGKMRTQNRPNDPAAIVIGPLAQMAIRRLSWMRSRSLRIGTAWSRPRVVGDDAHDWQPLP